MICILITSIFYLMSSDTHKQLSQPLIRLKEVVVPVVADSSSYYLGKNQQTNQEINEKYLRALGFIENPRLFPNDVWQNVTLPVFVTAISNDQTNHVHPFLKSVQESFPEATVFLYDLGLDEDQINHVIMHLHITPYK